MRESIAYRPSHRIRFHRQPKSAGIFPDTRVFADTDTNRDADTNADADCDANTDTNANANADRDADADTNTNADADCDAGGSTGGCGSPVIDCKLPDTADIKLDRRCGQYGLSNRLHFRDFCSCQLHDDRARNYDYDD